MKEILDLTSFKDYLNSVKVNFLLKRYIKSILKYFEISFHKLIFKFLQKKIIKKLKDKKKIDVYFLVSEKEKWNYQILYDLFLKSKIFFPKIVIFPNGNNNLTKKDSFLRNYSFFKNHKKLIKGVNKKYDIKNPNEIIKKGSLVFYDQPVPKLTDHWKPNKIALNHLIAYVPYGIKIANSLGELSHFGLDLHHYSWKIFCETNWHKLKFEKYTKNYGSIINTGHPKLDNYKIKKNYNYKKTKLKNFSKKIIWAPHWTIDHYLGVEHSTFKNNYKYFLFLKKNFKAIYWFFRPHQRLERQIIDTNFMKKNDLNIYFKKWNNKNSEHYSNYNYYKIFFSSDGLITDCGSFLMEYLFTGKPVLVLESGKNPGWNELGRKVYNVYYKAYNNEDILRFIKNVIIKKKDILKPKRERLIKFLLKDNQSFNNNSFNSSKKIFENINNFFS